MTEKTFEQNNKTIALNILFVLHNNNIYIYIYQNLTTSIKNQVILLVITDDGEKWHYLAVRSLSALLRGIASSNNGDF